MGVYGGVRVGEALSDHPMIRKDKSRMGWKNSAMANLSGKSRVMLMLGVTWWDFIEIPDFCQG